MVFIPPFSSAPPKLDSTYSKLTAGEDVSKGEALCITNSSESLKIDQSVGSANFGMMNIVYRLSQSFLTDSTTEIVNKISLICFRTGNPIGNIIVEIYNDDGSDKPTGSPLGTVTLACSAISTEETWYDFIFSSDIVVSPTTKYIIVAKSSDNNNGSNIVYIKQENSNIYSDGKYGYSVDGGSNWTPNTNTDLAFKVYGSQAQSGLMKTDATDTEKINFIGFAVSSALQGETIKIDTSGITNTQSELIVGATYYLSNTAGAISTTPGSNSIKVGTAITENKILIQHN
ncbi:MAG: DUF2190 family protein [Deltaproteobacteria bacterium]|nr:DUF2190 family protein [Deltaproteobacteria bacterium]